MKYSYDDWVLMKCSSGYGTLITLTGIPAFFILKWGSNATQTARSCTIFLQKLMNVVPQQKEEALL